MTVAIDATPLTLSSGGIARYTSELTRALAENFPDDRFILCGPGLPDRLSWPVTPGPGTTLRWCEESNAVQPGRSRRVGWLDRRWWLWGVQREMSRRGADLFHGTHFEVPLLPLRPAVATVHDLSPWMDPSWQRDAQRVRRRAPLLLGLGLATMVIAPTEAVRRQVVERFRVHPSRVVAVPEAAASWFQPAPNSSEGAPYFLCVGTLEPRKNLGLLLAAWREVRRSHPVDLVLAGRRRSDFPPLAPEPGLRVLGEVPDEDLPRLYSGALACAYPSLYEGFGLPVLEAMQCGAPVIASTDPAVSEVAAGAALQLDARDARAWVEAMAALASRPDLRAAWRERSLVRARDFSWRRTAQLTREV